MKNFIILNKNKIQLIISVLFWFTVWHTASIILKQEILLVSPVLVLKRLFFLIQQLYFWQSILFSFSRVILGFFTAVILGIIFAVISFRLNFFKILLQPLMSAIKATPVASYIVLCLVFMSSKNISAFISFIMVLPVIYTNTLKGIENVDIKLIEMANIFGMRIKNRVVYIYTPQVLPYFLSAATISLGLCWKAGIAAEVIGIPSGSIGRQIYMAKTYLDMKDLFAWTVVIIVISFIFEKLFLFAIKKSVEFFERK